MSKIRIYELAKELGLDNKSVVVRAQQLGIPGIKSHSNSLSDEETTQIRRSFLRGGLDGADAVDNSTAEKTVHVNVDSETGERSALIERRQGNIIRRRRTAVVEQDEIASEPQIDLNVASEAIVNLPVDRIAEANDLFVKPELVVTQDAIEEEADEVFEEQQVVPQVEEIEQLSTIDFSVARAHQPASGPKVLGKMELVSKVVKTERDAKETKDNRRGGTAAKKIGGFKIVDFTNIPDSDESDKRRGGANKKSKVVEFSRGQLLDYETKRRKARNSRDDRHDSNSDSNNVIANATKASKRVIRMPGEYITVGDLAGQMSLKTGQVIGKLMELGVMATINQPIDQDTATIVASEFDFSLEFSGFDESDLIKIEGIDDPEKQVPRSPVVTVMGHVDHGKTSLLDYLRKSAVVAKEHGGITQHIGAYQVTTPSKKIVTFIDTPGHAAFTEMRSRGANLTDIVILVVAADDGVMPQTLEALNHAKAAGVPIIVAMNKMDKPEANPEKIKTQLAERGLQPEDWGGDTMFMPVSAKVGTGMDELLESIMLVAEVQELKANPECRVKGTVIEVKQEQGRGTVATVLIQAGTLTTGDFFLVGAGTGRVRSMMDHARKPIKTAIPSTPVEITGFNETPAAGDDFIVMESEMKAKEVANFRAIKQRDKLHLELAGGPISLEEFTRQAASAAFEELRVIVKADVHGSLEAVRQSLESLSTEEVKVKILHSAVGGVSESDIQLALASKTIIVGFNVRGEPRAMQQAESQGIEVRFYRVIYELIDDVKKAMSGLLSPEKQEVSLARAEVRDTFSVPKAGVIAGCYVTDGKVERGARVRLLRDSIVIYEGNMKTLRRFKDDVKEVNSGYECGMAIEGYNDIKVGDVIEVYRVKEVQRTLA